MKKKLNEKIRFAEIISNFPRLIKKQQKKTNVKEIKENKKTKYKIRMKKLTISISKKK